MKFFISSDNLKAFFRVPGTIQAGDRLSAVAQKYSDRDMHKFIGDTYANYYVLDASRSSQYSNVSNVSNVWNVKASSVRYIMFDGRGCVIVMGISDQLWTLDETGTNLIDLTVVKSDMTVVGGTGEFRGVTSGVYEVTTIGQKFHEGLILFDRSLHHLWSLHIIAGGILLIFLCWWAFRKMV